MGENENIRAIIVDDEKKACTNLNNILVEYIAEKIDIVGIAHNTIEAEKQINNLFPDIVFLDIEMPNENAFHFLDRISPINFEVIFVTSYDEYAVRAFRLNAVDYILKPISISELRDAIQKLKEKLRFKKNIAENKLSFTELSDQIVNKVTQNKITLKHAGGLEILDFKDICFIEAQSSYSKLVFLKATEIKEITMSYPLTDYEELLPANVFYRIHRSYLVNCNRIKKILKEDLVIKIMDISFHLPISRRRHNSFIDFLKNNDYCNE